MMKLEKYIDHTLLKPTATEADIQRLCDEAKTYGFYAVCVNSSYVPLAYKALKDSKIKIAAVVGFPLGAMSTESKLFEARYCLDRGADEIDVVINLGWLKSGFTKKVLEELITLKRTIGNAVLKVIIETCYLTEEEKIMATGLVVDAGADFVKTSTGFGTDGASFEDVVLMKKVVGDKVRIKASGGIRDRETAIKYIELGASRLGTSSGVKIIE